jgi:uncharacterized membrane protein YhaH (DUF805 family)
VVGPVQEALESVSQTAGRSFVLSGRSRVRDVIYFGLAIGLLGLAADVAIRILFSWYASVIAEVCFNALLALPFFALFVRRLHDQGRSGWWVLIVPPLLAVSAYDQIAVSFAVYDPNFMENASRPDMWRWLLLPVGAAFLLFVFLPGSIGTNDYGPDPREDNDPVVDS